MKRILLGCLVGELSILLLFVSNRKLVLFLMFLLSIFIVIITFGMNDFGYVVKNLVYFYLVSMLLGGGISFFLNEFHVPYVVIILISLFVFLKYIKCMIILKNHYSCYYHVKLYFDENQFVYLNAYLDTGNHLKDPYSHQDIILVNKEKVLSFQNYYYVPYHSLNHSGLLKCIKGRKLEIEEKVHDHFVIGLSEDKIGMDGIDCVISTNILEGLHD